MKAQKLAAINDQTSPLFRIMSIHNDNEPTRRSFDNNVTAFHIGKGYILSVAHALKTELKVFRSITEEMFQTDIIPHLAPAEVKQLSQFYALDKTSNKLYLNPALKNDYPQLHTILNRISYDTRIETLYKNKICKPFLIVQQRNLDFFNTPGANHLFNPDYRFFDPNSSRQTYIIELELTESFLSDDVALYRMVNTPSEIIDLIPKMDVDDEVYDDSEKDFFCLQSAPSDLSPGRMINEANIEGLLEQWNQQPDRIGGKFALEGLRYLIKGYFRFGSSGAPYLKFDKESGTFKVNAIQSEGCPIQLTMNNDRNGNFQWVNAIATPMANVMSNIEAHMVS